MSTRHTFGVHCAQAGIPIVRIQRLLGHSTPVMALRYMKHVPENYFAADAARVAASLSGIADREASAQAEPTRQGLKTSERTRCATILATSRLGARMLSSG